MIYSLLRYFLKCSWALLGLLLALAGLFQLPYTKKAIEQRLQKTFQEQGIEVQFSRLSGLMPLSFHIEDLSIQGPGYSLFAKSCTFSPSVWRLLQGQWGVSRLRSQDLVCEFWDERNSAEVPSDLLSLFPRALAIENFSLERVVFDRRLPSCSLQGFLFLGKGLESISCKGKVTFAKGQARFSLSSRDQSIGACSLQIEGRVFSEKNLLTGTAYMNLVFEDAALKRLLFFPTRDPLPLEGTLWGAFSTSAAEDIRTILGEDGKLFGKVYLFSDRSLFTENVRVSSTKVELPCSLSLKKGGIFGEARANLEDYKLEGIGGIEGGVLQGGLSLQNISENWEARVQTEVDGFDVQGYRLNRTTLDYEASFENGKLSGELYIGGSARGQSIVGSGLLSLAQEEGLFLEDFSLSSYWGKVQAGIRIDPKGFIQGSTRLVAEKCSFPLRGESLQSNLDLFVEWEGQKRQEILFTASLAEVFFSNLMSETAEVRGKSVGWENPDYQFEVFLKNMRYRSHLLDEVALQISNNGENHPFFLHLKGTSTTPLSCAAQGFWTFSSEDFLLNLQEFSLSYEDASCFLEEPLSIELGENIWSFSPFRILFPKGFLAGEMRASQDQVQVGLEGVDIPLSLLSFNPYEITTSGLGSLNLTYQERGENIAGSGSLSIEELRCFPNSPEETLYRGEASASYEGDDVVFSLSVELEEEGVCTCSGSVPFALLQGDTGSISPWKGNLFYDGRAEYLLDLLNTGAHRFAGDVYTNMHWAGSPAHPHLEGSLLCKNGMYENYFTGSYFEEISLKIEGQGSQPLFASLEGFDGSGGTFYGTGTLRPRATEKSFFAASLVIEDLLILDIPMALVSASGVVQLQGTKKGARAEGSVEVVQARFLIPDSLPPRIPEIPLKKADSKNPNEASSMEYPLDLDIDVSTKSSVSIEGRGLTSRWRGKFLVGGTYNDIRPSGTLALSQGNFVFAGRSFDLTEGRFTFRPQQKIPLLSIVATTNVLGTSITAALQGTLERPELRFTSTPPLPLSSLLSLLIFGEDLSELSVFQTAVLAGSAASLSGKGPDVFQATRSTLGIDRFSVVHTPGYRQDEKDTSSESSALQVGKYVIDGVLVTVSQGLEERSSNVGIQVDLWKGFIFQAETIQQQEQGQFSIRWSHHY
ncbi:MAG: translocation/assembly module TamB domain-containing protein [Chlamydiota bacterium]